MFGLGPSLLQGSNSSFCCGSQGCCYLDYYSRCVPLQASDEAFIQALGTMKSGKSSGLKCFCFLGHTRIATCRKPLPATNSWLLTLGAQRLHLEPWSLAPDTCTLALGSSAWHQHPGSWLLEPSANTLALSFQHPHPNPQFLSSLRLAPGANTLALGS